MDFNKEELLAQSAAALTESLQVLVRSALEAKEASTHPDSKAENKYDTRGLEASYLATGQAERVQEMKEKLFQMENVCIRDFIDEPINISALVKVRIESKTERIFFVLPVGGLDLNCENQTVTTIGLDSPIGKNIYHQKTGHEFEVNNKSYEIIEIS